jgi:hypothetical protein
VDNQGQRQRGRSDEGRGIVGEKMKPRAARGDGAPQATRRGAGRGAPATNRR